jgi:nucleotide-binding universal stress UspA family protein
MSDASPTSPTDAPAQPGAATPGLFLVVVDNTPEMRVALRWASRRARRTGGHVGLLRVIRAADYQHWAAIGNLMQVEAREEAEQLLQEYAAEVTSLHGAMPVLYIKEGDTKSALIELIEEDTDIRVLVLAASTGGRGPGPLISFLMKKVIGRLRIPVTIVPGGLSDEQIDELV